MLRGWNANLIISGGLALICFLLLLKRVRWFARIFGALAFFLFVAGMALLVYLFQVLDQPAVRAECVSGIGLSPACIALIRTELKAAFMKTLFPVGGLVVLILFAILFVKLFRKRRHAVPIVYTARPPLDRNLARQAGDDGESRVRYALSFLPDEYRQFHGLSLKAGRLDQQEFDHVIVGPNGIFNLETKNWAGTIRINEHGEWAQRRFGQTDWSPKESPAFQALRHRRVLEELLGRDAPIHDCIIMANESVEVVGREYCPLPILKADALLSLVLAKQITQQLSDSQIEQICTFIRLATVPNRVYGGD